LCAGSKSDPRCIPESRSVPDKRMVGSAHERMHGDILVDAGEVVSENLTDLDSAEKDWRSRSQSAELRSHQDEPAAGNVGAHHGRDLEALKGFGIDALARVHFDMRARNERLEPGEAGEAETGADDPEAGALGQVACCPFPHLGAYQDMIEVRA